MITDLSTVRDHPANVLDNANVTFTAEAKPGKIIVAVRDTTPADVLREYEALENVTFAALDNEALAALREAQTGGVVILGSLDYVARLVAIEDAVRALLGLGD
jgi:hypothetical protein